MVQTESLPAYLMKGVKETKECVAIKIIGEVFLEGIDHFQYVRLG